MPRFDVAIERTSPDAVVQIAGELDIASVALLHQALADVRDLEPRSVVLDVQGLLFVDARGLRGLRREAALLRCRGHRVRTVNLRPNVRRVSRLLGAELQLGAE